MRWMFCILCTDFMCPVRILPCVHELCNDCVERELKLPAPWKYATFAHSLARSLALSPPETRISSHVSSFITLRVQMCVFVYGWTDIGGYLPAGFSLEFGCLCACVRRCHRQDFWRGCDVEFTREQLVCLDPARRKDMNGTHASSHPRHTLTQTHAHTLLFTLARSPVLPRSFS